MIAVIFFCSLLTSGFSYAADLNGQVNVRGSSDPAVQVMITVVSAVGTTKIPYRVETNAEGEFFVKDLEPGRYKIIVNQTGFERFETETEVPAEGRFTKLAIDPKLSTDFETTVVTQVSRDPSKRELSIKKAASQPGAGLDPIRAVQNLPGVNRSSGFSSQVVIQGSAPKDTTYSIDSHEIPLIFHFGGLSSVLNPELTEGFDYLSAGYQSQYGRAMGGVINLRSKRWTDTYSRRLKGSAFIDTFNSGVALETPVGKESRFAIGARISYIGSVLKAALKKEEDFSLSVAPSYKDFSFIFDSPLSDRARFRLLGIASSDALDFILKETGGDPILRGNFESTLGFFRLIPSVSWKHSEVSESNFSLGMGRDFIFTSINDQYFNLRSTALSVRMEHKRKWNNEWSQTFGVDNRYVWSDVSFRFPQRFTEGGVSNPISTGNNQILDLKSVKTHQVGLYSQAVYHAEGSRLTLIPGLRFDSFSANSSNHLAPRFGARYELTSEGQLVFGSGIYFQPPQPQETTQGYGNPKLQSPSAIHLRLGYERDLSNDISRGSTLYLGVFSRWFRDLVVPSVNNYYSNDGSGKAYGFESQFQYQAAPWDASLIYTLSRSTRSTPTQGEYLFAYDQTHLLTLMAGVDLPRRWRISARFRYVSGPVQTPVVGGVSDLDNDVFLPVRGSLYSQRLDAFSMLDLRVDKKWIYDTWALTLYLDIINLLNRKNTESIEYSYDYRQSESVAGIPVLPTFGLRGEF